MAEQRPEDIVGKLDQLDLRKVTLEHLRQIRNPALRDALVDLVRTPAGDVALGHQNHGSHSNHSTEAVDFLRIQFGSEAGSPPS